VHASATWSEREKDMTCDGSDGDRGVEMSAWSSEYEISIGISMYDVLRT
jgi:hypothetical protein